MKLPRFLNTLLFCSAILTCACQRTQAPAIEQETGPVSRFFYGIEMNGRINGYKEMAQVAVQTDQGTLSHLTQHNHLRMHLMGKPMLTNVRNEPKATVDTWDYGWKGRETFQVAGMVYHCLCLREINHSSGEHGEIWVDEESGLVIQEFLQTSGIRTFLSDRKIMNRLEFSSLDDLLFYPVHEVISDFRKLDNMKVEMVANSAGESLSAGDLNNRGQSFEGTVKDNVVDGVFEIRRIPYDGTNAPGFPYDYPLDSLLKPYLEPGFLIESDHPDIRSKARAIVGTGDQNSWEAVKKLSRWVGTEIKGAIPGGGSALGTLQQREAECGGHSRLLAAFCRSLGIPARLAIGCIVFRHVIDPSWITVPGILLFTGLCGVIYLGMTGQLKWLSHSRFSLIMADRYSSEETYVCFHVNGNVTANISREDYLKYQDNYAFDQLCMNLGMLFIRYYQYWRENKQKEILNDLKSTH